MVLRGALAFALALPAAADPLSDLFNRRGYDRESILQQFPPDAPPRKPDENPAEKSQSGEKSNAENQNESQNESAIEETESEVETGISLQNESENNAANNSAAQENPNAESENGAPQFIPLGSLQPAETAEKIALVLPTLAGGLGGQAARNVHSGCLHGVRVSGRGAAVDLYPTDGAAAAAADGYRAAVNAGAQAVVGPLLKNNVRALLAQYPQTPAPTLLLQPGGGEGYFVMTLEAAREADDVARLLHSRGREKILIAEQNTARGVRQREAFETRWRELRGVLPGRIQIRDEESDWTRLFDALKEEEAAGTAVFAAGDADFAVKARNFSPQQYSVFAASVLQSRGETAAALLADNLHFMEMPWFLEGEAVPDLPEVRAQPALRQRFFVLGADACRAALDAPRWREGFLLRGLGGDWELSDGVFARRGVLAAYRAGQLRRLEE